MKRKVHIKFTSKMSIIVTNACYQKSFELGNISEDEYIDLIKLKNLGCDPPIDTRFMAKNLGKGELEIWYKPKSGHHWIRSGDADYKMFSYVYQNINNNRNEKGTEGTYEVQILD